MRNLVNNKSAMVELAREQPPRKLPALVLLCACLCTAGATGAQAGAVEVTAETPWVLPNASVAAGGLRPSLDLAVRDVRADWYAVFGLSPLIQNTFYPAHRIHGSHYLDVWGDLPGPTPAPTPNSTGVHVWFGDLHEVAATLVPSVVSAVAGVLGSDAEAHGCFVAPAVQGQHDYDAIVCTGVDARGAIYAAYEFSHAVLGVDPQHFWTENVPKALDPTKGSLAVHTVPVSAGAAGQPLYRVVSEADAAAGAAPPALTPTFRYRAMFLNDEDLLGNFAADPLGENVFSITAWNRIYEAILRLKGNAVIVGTATFPDERALDLASRRGLYLAEHHITILGNNPFQWPVGVPYSFGKSPEVQLAAWDATVRKQVEAGREMLWTVGYRGKNDYPFWIDDPEYNTTVERGALISQAMATQVGIVRKASGAESPEMFTYLWSEMTGLYDAGVLTIPDGVTIVHADRGNGYVDPGDINLTKAGDGLYFHTAVQPGKQVTECVPPSRIFDTLGEFVRRNATTILVLNPSDLKPVPASSKAVLDFVWDPSRFMAAASAQEAQKQYLTSWLTTQYGATALKDGRLLDLHVNMFEKNPYILGEQLDFNMGEGEVAQRVRNVALGALWAATTGDAGNLDAALKDASNFQSHVTANATAQLFLTYSEAQAVQGMIPADRQHFFSGHALLQTALWYHVSAALDNVTAAGRAVQSGNTGSVAVAAAADALSHAEALLAVERVAETAQFKGWYLAECLDGFANMRDVIRQLLAAVHNETVPQARPWRAGTGPWNSWFNYDMAPQHIDGDTHYPFFYADAGQPNFQHVVRHLCSATGGNCNGTVVGGQFAGPGSAVQLQSITPLASGTSVRYVTGSNRTGLSPSATSPAYSGPIGLSMPTYIAAAVFDAAGTALGPVSRSFFNGTV